MIEKWKSLRNAECKCSSKNKSRLITRNYIFLLCKHCLKRNDDFMKAIETC